MKNVCYHSTLFYYDGPQVIEARDAIGGHYVAVVIEPAEGHERYLVTGVAPEQLRRFRAGTLDLRALMTGDGAGEWYVTSGPAGLDQPLSLIPQTASLAESEWLPEAGFVLHEHPADDEALQEARARNNLVLAVSVEPPEAAEEHRIRVSTLVGLLEHVQTLVKHAYGAALRDLPLTARRAIDRSAAHSLDVVIPAAPGSFRVLLEAAQRPDLLGQNELQRALERIDLLFDGAGDPHAALASAKANRGHFAGAWLRLLRFLVEHQTGIHYAWAEPAFLTSSRGAITEAEAGPLVEILSGISNLGAEKVELLGALEKADVTNRLWRLSTSEGTFSGKIKEGGPSLEGLKLGSSYRFACEEEIEELAGSGREQRTLYLIERQPV